MRDVAPYLYSLVRRLRARSHRAFCLDFARLLRQFGFQRPDSQAVQAIKGTLWRWGLDAQFPAWKKPGRRDQVVIRLVTEPETVRPMPPPEAVAGGIGTPSPRLRLGGGDSRVLRSHTEDLATVAERALAATAEIRSPDGAGAGVIVHAKGLVLTARHVLDGEGGLSARRVKVRLGGGTRTTGLVFRSHRLDWALLWLESSGPFAFLPLGVPQSLRPAETVIAVGHPGIFVRSISRGVVSNPRARWNGIEWILTDAATDRGCSGGPVVNSAGQLVGVTSWVWEDEASGKFAAAMPIDYVAVEIESAVRAGPRRCLAAPYCRSCGHLNVTCPTWFCPVCGAQNLARGEVGATTVEGWGVRHR